MDGWMMDDGAFGFCRSLVGGADDDLHRRFLRVPIKRHAPRALDVHLRLYPADLSKFHNVVSTLLMFVVDGQRSQRSRG